MENQMSEEELKGPEIAEHMIKTILTILAPLDYATELAAAQTVLVTIAANHMRLGVIKDEESFINHISERAKVGIKRTLQEMRELEKTSKKEEAKNVH